MPTYMHGILFSEKRSRISHTLNRSIYVRRAGLANILIISERITGSIKKKKLFTVDFSSMGSSKKFRV